MSKSTASNPPGPENSTWYAFASDQLSFLEGRLLTILDASISDQEQRKALKDIMRQEVWNWAMNHTCRVEYEDVKFADFLTGSPTYSKLSERK